MDPLLEFTNQTDELRDNLINIQNEALNLHNETLELQGNLTAIIADIKNDLTACSGNPDCSEMRDRVNNLTVSDYSNISSGLEPLIQGLQVSAIDDLYPLLSGGYDSFKAIVANINSSVSDNIDDARDASDEVAVKIEDELDKVTEDLTDVGFADLADDLREISKDDMELPATITFWVFTGFAIIIALIVLLTWLGMNKDIPFHF